MRKTKKYALPPCLNGRNWSAGLAVTGEYELRRYGGATYRTHITHIIEEAATQEVYEEVKIAHRDLVDKLKTSDQMSEIGSRWKVAKSLILNGVLLAGDVVYPCCFCRSYFQD